MKLINGCCLKVGKGEFQGTPSTQVLIAALNEEEGIGLTITEMQMHLDNTSVLVIDGRSTDRTVEVAKNMGANIAFQDGLGKGNALAKAIEFSDSSVAPWNWRAPGARGRRR